jgi:hypothetical protein
MEAVEDEEFDQDYIGSSSEEEEENDEHEDDNTNNEEEEGNADVYIIKIYMPIDVNIVYRI